MKNIKNTNTNIILKFKNNVLIYLGAKRLCEVSHYTLKKCLFLLCYYYTVARIRYTVKYKSCNNDFSCYIIVL